jgi:hypothetical protein
MASASEYSNMYNAAINIIHAKGYQTWLDPVTQLFSAEKDGWDFQSESPCGLLGLIAVFEFIKPSAYSEYWWKNEGLLDYRQLPTTPSHYRPVWERGN